MITDACVSIPFGNWGELETVTVRGAWQQNLLEREIMRTEPRISFLLAHNGASAARAVQRRDLPEAAPRTRTEGKLDCPLG